MEILGTQNKIHELAVVFNEWFSQLETLNEQIKSPEKSTSDSLYEQIARAIKGNDTETYYRLSAEMNNLWMKKVSRQQKKRE